MPKRFDSDYLMFPIRGHSYLEYDKDFGLLNKKAVVKTPAQWVEVFRNARTRPSPFHVSDCTQDFFYA